MIGYSFGILFNFKSIYENKNVFIASQAYSRAKEMFASMKQTTPCPIGKFWLREMKGHVIVQYGLCTFRLGEYFFHSTTSIFWCTFTSEYCKIVFVERSPVLLRIEEIILYIDLCLAYCIYYLAISVCKRRILVKQNRRVSHLVFTVIIFLF